MRRKRLIVAAYLLLCAGIVVYGAVHLINSPSEGTVAVAKVPVTPPVTNVPISGTYASFAYPSNFDPAPTDKPVLPMLAAYSFIKRQTNPWSINIAITRLPSGILADDGSYNYRIKTTGRFTRTQQQFGDQQAEVFTDNQAPAYSQTAYIHHGTLDASITVSGATADDGQASINKRLGIVIGNWQWH